MNKLAVLFPGQGAQYVGMGEDFAKEYESARKVFSMASSAMGYSMENLCFNSSEDELKKTENTQPAILSASYAIYKVLEDKGIKPQAVAGLSLGEYTAHVASGSIKFDDAVKIVKKRGMYMQEEVPFGVGTMAAILGLERNHVEEACRRASEYGVVEPANYNCPMQLVIAGEVKAVEKAVEISKELGAKKAVILPVSAPFHTTMLTGAGDKLERELENCMYNEFSIPVVSNVTSAYYKNKCDIKELLVKQVSNPVLWEDSVKTLIDDGFNVFLEVGPGDSLSKFTKRISKDVKILNVSSVKDMDKVLETLGL